MKAARCWNTERLNGTLTTDIRLNKLHRYYSTYGSVFQPESEEILKNLDYRLIGRVNDIPARELIAQPYVDPSALRTPIQREREREHGAAAIGENLTIPTMLTVRETAERFNIPVHFVRVCVGNGSFVSVRAGRKFLINAESVVTFLSTGLPQGVACREVDLQTAPRIAPISLR